MSTDYDGTLDANVLLRFILNDVPEQTRRVDMLLEKPGANYWVSNTAISEVVYTLRSYYGWSRAHIIDIIDGVLQQQKFVLPEEFETAWEMFCKYSALSLNDCLIAVEAVRNNATPLFTFDRALARKLDEVVEL